MSDLTDFALHCRKMATAEHKPDCPSLGPPSRPVWTVRYDDAGEPYAMGWEGMTPEPPACPGCLTESNRALFARLAAEVDDLAPQPDLFGEVTAEPPPHPQPAVLGAMRGAVGSRG